jgi:hypothetical protein
MFGGRFPAKAEGCADKCCEPGLLVMRAHFPWPVQKRTAATRLIRPHGNTTRHAGMHASADAVCSCWLS